MRGPYGKVLPEVFRKKTKGNTSPTDRANEVNKGFIIWLCWIAVCSNFVEKTRKAGHLFLQDSNTHSESVIRCHYSQKNFSLL